MDEQSLVEEVRRAALPLAGADSDYDALLEHIGRARIVMLGEASHGTQEFYVEREQITRRLIEELNFSALAIEGDWPEARAVHQYITGGDGTAESALLAFTNFPPWMWANEDVLHMVQWLRTHNDGLQAATSKIGFYGLDVFSPYRSMEMIPDYLHRLDSQAAARIRDRYERYNPAEFNDHQASEKGITVSCSEDAESLLSELRRNYPEQQRSEAYFVCAQSAAVAIAGEKFYRARNQDDAASWNLRDTHMADALDVLLDHLGSSARVVVWEHNSHIGDFRATEADGKLNIGQLVRERHPGESFAVGFGTYQGTVTAADAWAQAPQSMPVPPAQRGSYDDIFHQVGMPRFLLLLQSILSGPLGAEHHNRRGQRAIGAVNAPEKDAESYTPTDLVARYDAYIHIDHTQAVTPLGSTSQGSNTVSNSSNEH